MIDPKNVDYRRNVDPYITEEFWLYSFLVAGKTSSTIAPRLDGMLMDLPRRAERKLIYPKKHNPFARISILFRDDIFTYNEAVQYLKEWGFGQQKRTLRFFKQTLELYTSKQGSGIEYYPVEYWSLKEIESIYGVGLKTSRFFLMNTRDNVRVAAIDTHILKYLKDKNVISEDVPLVTPTNKSTYEAYERLFIELADKRNMNIRDFDQQIWNHYSSKPKTEYKEAC